MIAKIAEVNPNNSNLITILVLDYLQDSDFSMLINEFGYGRENINESLKNYRNIALVIQLMPKEDNAINWKNFIERRIPKREHISKLDNLFVNKNYDKVLLITNRRLISADLRNLNEKIKKINADIGIMEDSFEKEAAMMKEKGGIISTIKSMFS